MKCGPGRPCTGGRGRAEEGAPKSYRRCKPCGGKAVIHMPQHRLALCRACYPPWFEKQTQRTIERFHMFGKTDRILVAVSGGKDSLGLWHALLQLGYVADGLYIHLRIQGSDGLAYSQRSLEFARAYADRSGRELIVVDLQETMGFGIPEIQRAVHRPACSPCGTTKRHYMNKVAVERGYDGLATGHNLDDEAATLFSNTLRWDMDYLARQTPVLPAAEGFARKVKPFCFFSEKETALYAVLEGVPYIREECPFALGATSLEHKDVINRLEHESPGTKRAFLANFLSAKDRLPAPAPPAMKPCRECGSPSPVEVCAFCRLRAATLARGSGLALTQVGARSVEGQGAVVCQVKT